jgi:hypothetical protein
MQDMAKYRKEAKKNKVKIEKKKNGEWVELSNEQKIIIKEKGVGEEYWFRMIEGPY